MKWHKSGSWEIKDGRSICRWFISWSEYKDGFIGAIAGYSGGGSFQLEKFYISNSKVVTSDEEDYADLDTDALVNAEDGQDLIFAYNDEEKWFESDTLILMDLNLDEFDENTGFLSIGEKVPEMLIQLYEKVGLTSKPNSSHTVLIG